MNKKTSNIEIKCSELPDKEKLFLLLYPENSKSELDPRSRFYKRKLERPNIKLQAIIIKIVLTCLLTIGVWQVVFMYTNSISKAIFGAVLFLSSYVFLHARKIIVCVVQLYQRYAPDRIRNKCRFEPSCSQYMLLAIDKYGVIKGVFKGLARLKRCRPDNGGYDFP